MMNVVHFSRTHAGESLAENTVGRQSQVKVENREQVPDAEKSAIIVRHKNTRQTSAKKINTLECNFCHIKFQNVPSMHDHITKVHVDERRFTCIFCKCAFKSIVSFTNHVHGIICGKARSSNGVYFFSCDKCPKTFSHPRSLRRHLCRDHRHEAPIKTEIEEKLNDQRSSSSSPQTFSNLKLHVNHSWNSSPLNTQVPSTSMISSKSLDSRARGFESEIWSQGFATAEALATRSMAQRRPTEKGGLEVQSDEVGAARDALNASEPETGKEVGKLQTPKVSSNEATTKPQLLGPMLMAMKTTLKEYSCLYCARKFSNLKGITTHSRVHRESLKCPYCPKLYWNARTLFEHIRIHRRAVDPSTNVSLGVDPAAATISRFKCGMCSEKFDCMRALTGHWKVHSERKFKCPDCDKSYGSRKALVAHAKLHVRVEPVEIRPRPSVSAGDQNCSVEVDLGGSKGKELFSCQFCSRTFATHRGYARHSKVHADRSRDAVVVKEESEDTKAFVCHICGVQYENGQQLGGHMSYHSRAGHATPPPPTSSNSWIDTEDLKGVELNEKDQFICDTCDEIFRSRDKLSEHVRSRHGGDPLLLAAVSTSSVNQSLPNGFVARKIYERPFCSKKSSSTLMFKKHEKFKSTNGCYSPALIVDLENEQLLEDPIEVSSSPMCKRVCRSFEPAEQTDQELPDNSVLQTREGGKGRFVFEQCDSSERYHCSECDETYVEKLQMLIHMSYHIMDSERCNCDNYSLLIKTDSSLLAPFKCNFCSQRFINKKYRNMHVCKRHRDDILQCGICRKLFICKETLKQHYEQHNQQQPQPNCEMSDDVVKATEMDDCEIVENYPYIKEEPVEEMYVEGRNFEDDVGVNPSCVNVTSRSVFESLSVEQCRTFVENETVKLENLADVQSFGCSDCCDKRRVASKSGTRAHKKQPQKLLHRCKLCNLYFVDAKNAEAHSKMHDIVKQELEN